MRYAKCLLVLVALTVVEAARCEVTVANDLAADFAGLGVPQTCVLDGPRAETMIEGILPKIEQAAGKSFVATPRVRLASPTEFAEALGTKFVNDAPIQTEMNPDQVAKFARSASRAIAPFLLGFFSSVGDTVYLSPTRLLELVHKAGGTEQDCEAVIRLVMIHEFVHALQNQHVDLVKSHSRCTTMEQFQRFQSRVEGHANSIQGEVATSLGVGTDTLEISRRIIVGAVAGDQPEPGTLGAILEEQYAMVEDVTALIDSTTKSCGRAAVWKALGTPCDETSLLERCATGDRGCEACEP